MIGFLNRLFTFRARAANPYPGSRTDEQYPSRPELALDQRDLLSRLNHKQLLNSTRHIFNAYPMVSGACKDIANHAVGQSWQPQHKGTDLAFAGVAEDWLKNHCKIIDARGFPYSLTADMRVGLITILRDGEFFIYSTSTPSGYPLIQMFEAHRIGTRSGMDFREITEGPYKGLQQRNGIAYSAIGRPVAYHFLADDPMLDQWIPAARITHVYDPEWFSQGRGISPLVYGILDWLDVHGWRENEKMAQMILSSIAYTEANEEGAPNTLQERLKAAAAGEAQTATATKPQQENFVSGMVRYLKLNGSNIKALENNRPSPNQANFEERVLRGAFRALGWTYEQAYNSAGQGGANVRRDVAQNQKSIEHWQGVLTPAWSRVIVYSLAVANTLGLLSGRDGKPIAMPPDWYKWRPQLPQKMTVDHGRDRRMDIEEIRTGARTMVQDIRDRGGDEVDHLHEQVNFYKLKKEIAEAEGIPREEWIEVFGTLLVNPAATQIVVEKEE